MNKEIVKLQNYFDSINLRNDINIKNAMKKIENVKLKNWKPLSKLDDDIINNEVIAHINNENSSNLVLQKDKTFKMQVKPRRQFNPLNTKINKRKNKGNHYSIVRKDDTTNGANEEGINHDNLEEMKCDKNISFNNNVDFNYNVKVNSHIHNDQNDSNSFNELNDFRTDLQSLLIMMAINSKIGGNEEYNCDAVADETIPNKEFDEKNVQIVTNFEKETTKISELMCIIPLRTETQDRYELISKKYIRKWKSFVKKKKQIKQREAVVNKFLDKLAEKKNNTNQTLEHTNKAKLHIRDYKTYQHRFKVQQNIIALQKMKLEEQTKIIEQLKYNKIIESSKQSLEAMREDISKTYYQIDRQLKPKIKCLTNELKMREIEEPALVLHCLKVPQFIQRMEKRARERDEKHAIIRERRRQMEEERIKHKQQVELDKAEMDKEEKLKRMKELREKRKREKIENIRKKQHAERMRALVVMADLHYEKNLMLKYGINPLKRLMEIKREDIDNAKSHYLFQIKKNVFLHWMWHTEDMWFERNYKAEEFHRNKMLRKVFHCFKKNHHEYRLKLQVAEDYYDLYVTQFVFRKFREGIELIQKEIKIKWYTAVLYHNSNLLFKTFTCWRTLPALNALKREQEARKLRWRKKVLQVVPDYTPPDE